MATAAPTSPFIWGQGGQALSPQEVARQRQVASALAARGGAPQNVGQGLNRVGEALLYRSMIDRAGQAETQGQESAASVFDALLAQSDPGMQDIMGVVNNPWLNDGQSAVAGALLQQEMAPPPEPMVINDQLVSPTDYQVLGDFRDTPEQPDQWRPLSPQEAATYGVPEGTAAQINEATGKIQGIGGVNVEVNTGDGAYTPGWEAIDKAFADTYLSWIGGESADTRAQLASLQNAMALLEGGEPLTGQAFNTLPRAVQAFISPDGIIARENVEEVVQRSLRATLGSQFTEGEGERLIQRAFNPLLPPQENIRRVNLLMAKIAQMAEAKDGMTAYFQQHGTLQGYTGPTLSEGSMLAVEQQFGEDPAEGESGIPGQSGISDGMTATNPETGEQVVYRNGQWVPVM